ncbi:hypothetical protein [Acidithiobacillus caldus]|nr:hypothetical protein [Acidithiobacillus caldus]
MSDKEQSPQSEYVQACRILGVALISGAVTIGSALLLLLLWWLR